MVPATFGNTSQGKVALTRGCSVALLFDIILDRISPSSCSSAKAAVHSIKFKIIKEFPHLSVSALPFFDCSGCSFILSIKSLSRVESKGEERQRIGD